MADAPGSCDAPGSLEIRCDDSTDCPAGQVCCGTFSQTAGYSAIECKTSCTGSGGNTQAVRFCDPANPVDECSSIGLRCQASASLPGYHVCK